MKNVKIKFILLLMILLLNNLDSWSEENLIFEPYGSVQGIMDYKTKSKELGANSTREKDFGFELVDAVLGFNIKKDKLSGTFELVLADNNLAEIGLAYGQYEFYDLNFLFGLNDSPYTYNSNEVSFAGSNLIGFGTTTEDKALVQVQLNYSGFYISIIETNKPQNDSGDYILGNQIVSDYEIILPKSAIGYTFESEIFTFTLGAAMNQVKVNDESLAIDGKVINSYLAHGNFCINMGLFSLMGNIGYSVNPLEFGLVQEVDSSLVINGDSIDDTETLEGYLEGALNYEVLTFRAGLGYIEADNKTFVKKDKALAYYFQTAIEANENLTFIPELSIHDLLKDKDGNEEGKEFSVGLFVEISF